MKQKYLKVSVQTSLPEPVYQNLYLMAQQEKISPAHAAARLISKALGFHPDTIKEFIDSERRSSPRELARPASIKSVIEARRIEYPQSLVDLLQEPCRLSSQYHMLLQPNSKWGDGSVITETERKMIQQARPIYEVVLYIPS